MKKKTKIIIIATIIPLLILIILAGAVLFEITRYDDKLSSKITKNSWDRDGDGDTETIYFNEDGDFGYYCACGNPIDNYDLCSSYRYDKESNTIKLTCFPGAGITKLKVVEVTDYELTLDFDGEKRTFRSPDAPPLNIPFPLENKVLKATNNSSLKIEFQTDGSFKLTGNTNHDLVENFQTCHTYHYEHNDDAIWTECEDAIYYIYIKKINKKDNTAVLTFEDYNKTITFEITDIE